MDGKSSKEEMKEAVIYPLLPEHIDRIFQGRDIFCKYVGKGIPKIKKDGKLFFYATGGQCEVLGEAKIKTMEFLTPEEIIAKYRDRLFITSEELANYRKRRDRTPDKKLMVLSLSNIRKYDKPRKLSKRLTMSGQTLSKEKYEEFCQNTWN